MCYELHLILWLSKKLSKKKVGWLVVFLGFPPPFFVQGVSTILACVFAHPVDLGQGGICQEGEQLPKAMARVQSSLVQFGIARLLLTSFFWAPYLSPSFWNSLPPLFLYYCSSWICTVPWYSCNVHWQHKLSFSNGSSQMFLKRLRK